MTDETTGRSAYRVPPSQRTGGRRAGATKEEKTRSAWLSATLTVAHWATLILGPVILLSAIAATVLYVRLSHGPISLERIADRIERGINADLSGVQAKIGSAVVEMSPDHAVELRLVDVTLVKPDGTTAAFAPLAAVELNTSALLNATLRPERIFLIEPEIALRYTADAGLVLSIEAPESQAQERGTRLEGVPAPRPATAPRTTEIRKTQPSPSGEPHSAQLFGAQVDLARALSTAMTQARQSQDATSHIKAVGVRNARLVIHTETTSSEFQIQQASVSLDHTYQNSILTGTATLRSDGKPWLVGFRAQDSGVTDSIKIDATIKNLVPSAIAKNAPQLQALIPLQMPVDGDLALDMSTSGEIRDLRVNLNVAAGTVELADWKTKPLSIDSAQITLVYDPKTGITNIAPSQVRAGQGYANFVGTIQKAATNGDTTVPWIIQTGTTEGVLAPHKTGGTPIPLDQLTATVKVTPTTGTTRLTNLTLEAAGAKISATGVIEPSQGAASTPAVRVDAKMSEVDVKTLKALWPVGILNETRTWIQDRITKSTIQSANLKFISGAEPSRNRLSLTLNAVNSELTPAAQTLPIQADKALIRIENDAFELTVPKAKMVAGETRVPLTNVRYTIVDLTKPNPFGELAFKTDTTIAKLRNAIERSAVAAAQLGNLPLDGISGKVKGNLSIRVPLSDTDTVAALAPAQIFGTAKLSSLKGKILETAFKLSGGSIDLKVSPDGLTATGDLIINGVVAKIAARQLQDAPYGQQPPVRLTAVLDAADRTQLGLDVNHMVLGDVPIDLTIPQLITEDQPIQVSADLSKAELRLSDLAWGKPPGERAKLEFDVVGEEDGSVDLEKLKLVSNNMAIEGRMEIGSDQFIRKFEFPNFSLNVVSRLAISGNRDKKGIWKVDAKGSTYDAKELFLSLLTLGKPTEKALEPREPKKGLDLKANVDTVLGHDDLQLRSVELNLSRRNQQLVSLDFGGKYENGKTITATIKPDGTRRLVAKSDDAGRTLRLVGLYPNLRGGVMRLDTGLGDKGATETKGLLRVQNFKILGDPVIQDLYSSAELGESADERRRKNKRVVREVFEFTQMRLPFTVGQGQFVLNGAQLRGPLLGASLRGKVDYTTERLNLGGTYVPLQGLNAALCEIPLVGPIVSGLDCQGMFGITFAVQGAMANPQVLVNPLSMLTPGIFRGIMEMGNQNPTVNRGPIGRPGQRNSRRQPQPNTRANAPIDGWNSQTSRP